MTEIVAEISGNHGGSIDNAVDLIYHAKESGADAVKFQCFEPERLAERRSNNPEVLKLANGQSLVDLYRKTHTPKEWFPYLIGWCRDYQIPWFSSVFDPQDVAFLETLDCPRYKISAFEVMEWDIIKAVKETGKPVVMSVRPTHNLMFLQATNYDGTIPLLGMSDHGKHTPFGVPMIEWHIKLPGINTPDSDFSLTPQEMARMVSFIRKQAA